MLFAIMSCLVCFPEEARTLLDAPDSETVGKDKHQARSDGSLKISWLRPVLQSMRVTSYSQCSQRLLVMLVLCFYLPPKGLTRWILIHLLLPLDRRFLRRDAQARRP